MRRFSESFEHRSEPLLSTREFVSRMARHGGLAGAFALIALGIGMLGYRWTEGMDWLDAFLNASMILAGMGPVSPLASDAAKLFAGFYALFSGLVVLAVAGVLAAPIVHRLLHRLHLEERDSSEEGE